MSSALRAFLSLDDPLRGFVPLLKSKTGALKGTFFAALMLFLGFGLLSLLAQGSPGEVAESLRAMWLAMSCLVVALLPMILCGYIGFSRAVTTATGRCRREELLTLPLGRLAIPTMILAVSCLGLVAWTLGSLAGALLGFGPEVTWGALTAGKDAALAVRYALPIVVTVFTGAVAFTSIGNNNAMITLGWGFMPLIIGIALPGMGYEGDLLPFIWLWCVPLTLFHLLLPFLLYALPPQHWSDNKPETVGTALVLQLLAYPLFLLPALLGASWLLVGLAPAAGLVWLCVRNATPPEHRSVSGTQVGLVLGLVFTVPSLLVCMATDAYVLATPVTQEHASVMRAVPSPDGRRVALEVRPRPLGGEMFSDVFGALTITRVVIVDPSGETPPVQLAPRFAKIGGWSADGAYLAVQSETLGRFHYDEAPHATTRLGFWRRLRWSLPTSVAHTLIYDVAKAEVTRSYPRKVVKPGWTAPEQLAHYGVALRAKKLTLTDGTGRTLEVDPQLKLRLARYGPEGPILSHPVSKKHSEPWVVGVGSLRQAWWRWGANGLVPLATDGRWQITRLTDEVEKTAQLARLQAWKKGLAGDKIAWKQGLRPPKRLKPLPRQAFRFTRGEETVVVRDLLQLHRTSFADGAVLAVAPEGVVRIALPSGKRTVLLPTPANLRRVNLLQLEGGAFVTQLPDRSCVALTGPDWTSQTFAVGPRQTVGAVLPGELVTVSSDTLRGGPAHVVNAAGERRPLLPR